MSGFIKKYREDEACPELVEGVGLINQKEDFS